MKVSSIGGINTYNYKKSTGVNRTATSTIGHDSFVLSSKRPSFGDGWKVDKEKFDVLEASDTRLEYLGEVFRKASKQQIEQACKKKYGGLFFDRSDQARNKLLDYIYSAQRKMGKLETEIPKTAQRIKTGDIGIEAGKDKLQTEFISKINNEQQFGTKAENLPNAILIVNDGENKVADSMRDWLKDNTRINYSSIYPGNYGWDFEKEIKSLLEYNKKIFDLTGIRSLLELDGLDYIFSKSTIFNYEKEQKGLYNLLNNASDKYKTTILYITQKNRDDLKPELFSKEHFDTQIHLKDGERPEDKSKLADMEFQKESMENAAKRLDSYIWYEVDSDYESDDTPDPRDDWRDRM